MQLRHLSERGGAALRQRRALRLADAQPALRSTFDNGTSRPASLINVLFQESVLVGCARSSPHIK